MLISFWLFLSAALAQDFPLCAPDPNPDSNVFGKIVTMLNRDPEADDDIEAEKLMQEIPASSSQLFRCVLQNTNNETPLLELTRRGMRRTMKTLTNKISVEADNFLALDLCLLPSDTGDNIFHLAAATNDEELIVTLADFLGQYSAFLLLEISEASKNQASQTPLQFSRSLKKFAAIDALQKLEKFFPNVPRNPKKVQSSVVASEIKSLVDEGKQSFKLQSSVVASEIDLMHTEGGSKGISVYKKTQTETSKFDSNEAADVADLLSPIGSSLKSAIPKSESISNMKISPESIKSQKKSQKSFRYNIKQETTSKKKKQKKQKQKKTNGKKQYYRDPLPSGQ
eukprot:GHVP01068166.1.p1 GENE.GHVP01068166.1~~GHVP01068166.1.p1  ORF type:complete len:340 (+),score=82.77 GHVP01068166.1:184-1203(+)